MYKVAETFVQSWRYNTNVEKNNAKHCFDFITNNTASFTSPVISHFA